MSNALKAGTKRRDHRTDRVFYFISSGDLHVQENHRRCHRCCFQLRRFRRSHSGNSGNSGKSRFMGCNARCNSPLHLARKDRFTHATSPSRPVRNRPSDPLGPRRHSRWRLPKGEEASPHTIALLGPPLPALRLRRFTPFAAPQAEQRGYRLASLSP